jgi:hypothetical protein
MVFFASCKKEEMAIPPVTPEDAAVSRAQRGNGNSLIAEPTSTLTRRDNDTLIYYNDGRLAKVQHGAGSYTAYTYGFNTITAKTFSRFNNQVEEEMVYQVDGQTGRVYESKSSVYSNSNIGAIVIKKTWKYEYDADGHIKKKYNKDKPLERTFFSWSPEGNLINAAFYDEYNDDYLKVHFGRHANADKLKLQPKRAQLDPYLKIFGKGSKTMLYYEQVYTINNQPPTTYENFNYTYNADGYPITCTVADGNNNYQIIRTFNYSYLASRNK